MRTHKIIQPFFRLYIFVEDSLHEFANEPHIGVLDVGEQHLAIPNKCINVGSPDHECLDQQNQDGFVLLVDAYIVEDVLAHYEYDYLRALEQDGLDLGWSDIDEILVQKQFAPTLPSLISPEAAFLTEISQLILSKLQTLHSLWQFIIC